MKSTRYAVTCFGGDEVGDYRAADDASFGSIMIGSYGFDTEKRLIKTGEVPKDLIFKSPEKLILELERRFDGVL